MLKETITYTDFNGVERTEEYNFHLTKAEILEMQYGKEGGLSAYLTRISQAMDGPKLVKEFKELLLKSYGVKSDDGKRFIKNDQIRDEFSQSEAYSIMFTRLATDTDYAVKFITGIIPADLADLVKDQMPSVVNK